LDSKNYRSKIFFKKERKNPETSVKQNLNLPYVSNYFHSMYIVLSVTKDDLKYTRGWA